MINLLGDFLKQARVDGRIPAIVLHFRNSADEYFTMYIVIDRAFKLEEQLDNIRTYDFSVAKAYKLYPDLRTEFIEPTAQDWFPAPVPGDSIISLEQYMAHMKLPHEEDKQSEQ